MEGGGPTQVTRVWGGDDEGVTRDLLIDTVTRRGGQSGIAVSWHSVTGKLSSWAKAHGEMWPFSIDMDLLWPQLGAVTADGWLMVLFQQRQWGSQAPRRKLYPRSGATRLWLVSDSKELVDNSLISFHFFCLIINSDHSGTPVVLHFWILFFLFNSCSSPHWPAPCDLAASERRPVKKCRGLLCLQWTAINEKLIISQSTKVNFGQKPFDLEQLTPPALVTALAPSRGDTCSDLWHGPVAAE